MSAFWISRLIAFDFGPDVSVGGLLVRWQTIGLSAAIFIAIAMAALNVTIKSSRSTNLRQDDLLYLLLGVVPGAILGGRLGYVLVHLDFYVAHPEAGFNVSQGSLELGLAVVGGVAGALVAAVLLEGPIRAWFHVAAIPVLVGLAVGKFSMILGGEGQGMPTNLPWATAYVAQASWGSLMPQTPSHPAQMYEGLGTILILVVLVALLWRGHFSDLDGSIFWTGIALWGVVRFCAAFFWRDPEILGPLRADQIIALFIAAACVGIVAWERFAATHPSQRGSTQDEPSPANRRVSSS